ncbi:S-adenosyl-L-methionine-dependent methyltransferase [Mycotypha africana]|uniref:S-adenosyl-L-methionine-dependent methyltransferase n=1 Tax=Mycotypha africana TaxID=64632 RepID=UPI0023014448|nr:S-adenosyl-L-methionine-dependent methyltransferase [Mycotypha africana]KAI8987681.1 S-adenosyl-L-methionine-dependent methyltransferase [Mycotypha africana]
MNRFTDDYETNDDIIRGTNDDATVSRLSAVDVGYLEDPFVKLFVKRPDRRSPIINRGSFIRSYAINSLVSQFLTLSGCDKKQIVALGAGFDTRYFNIKANVLDKEGRSNLSKHLLRYYEIDFPEITMKKAMTIKRQKVFSQLLAGDVKLERGGMDLKCSDYCLLGGDLRNWHEIVRKLEEAGLDKNAPTLFLSECVFIYISPDASSTILEWITQNMTNTMFALYEQIRPNDAFGKMMIRNLKTRHIELKGLQAFPDLADQEERFKNLGWQTAKAVDINTIHDDYLSKSELARLARLEILDEFEEWHLLAAHYCVVWATKSKVYGKEMEQISL